jgi:hypothetical protein
MAVQRVKKIECHVMGVSPALLSSTNCSTIKSKPWPLQCARMKHQVAGCSIGARRKSKRAASRELAEDGLSSDGPPPDYHALLQEMECWGKEHGKQKVHCVFPPSELQLLA